MSVTVYSKSQVDAVLLQLSRQPSTLLGNQAEVFYQVSAAAKQPDLAQCMQIPQRLAINAPNHHMLFMPARALDTTAIKIVSVPKDGIPGGIPGTTLLFDDETGVLKAVMDASSLTAARTAAGSALATALVLPPGTSTVSGIAVYGSGAQAYWHALLLTSLYERTLEMVAFMVPKGRSSTRARATLDRLKAALMPERSSTLSFLVSENKNLLKHADIVCCCTPSTTPLFRMNSLKPGAHLNLIGSYKPHMQEVEEQLVLQAQSRGLIMVDSISSCRTEAGDLLKAEIDWTKTRELGTLVQPPPAVEVDVAANERERSEMDVASIGKDSTRFTIFKSVGIGAQDVAIAKLVQRFASGQTVHV
ncbi:NAD(P)-binding protein [Tilletiaria anomala UBC 951]|uniref:NAD(P)-binding protein n=1 Tax=Tilletiaria anomala (strain ATCC 24038 / CBS 436.72 / UBC 951) TaxID=1037660 RepID=A0A066WK76_TILAU|nr:NAD(P)-binding protein [Tilletiaria anomala UBC 951]KDN51419.1 NAD(P)-binding protein [Tilletiaria anomala UBC 951]